MYPRIMTVQKLYLTVLPRICRPAEQLSFSSQPVLRAYCVQLKDGWLSTFTDNNVF